MVKDKSRDSFAMLLQGFDRGLFILAHQPTVPLDVSAENSGELAFDAFSVHGITPANTKASEEVKKSLGGLIFSTFWKLSFITSSRRLRL
jgi:hypothetical protein